MKRFLILLAAMAIVLPACTNDNNETTPCTHTSWTDGICNDCGEECSHSWDNGTCTICGMACTHTWGNGTCIVCGMVCAHSTVEDGACKECGEGIKDYYYDKSANTYTVRTADALNTAISNAGTSGTTGNPATIKLAANMEVAGTPDEYGYLNQDILVDNGVITLDLNGHAITSTSEAFCVIMVDNGATLTIDDSSEGKQGKIKIVGNNAVGSYNGKLVINGGTFEGEYAAVWGFDNNATIEINGGTFIATNNAVEAQSSILTITGGTFIGNRYALSLKTWGTASITGGSFSGGEYDIDTVGKTGLLSYNEETGIGPTFPGGLSIWTSESSGLNLNALLADGAAYYDADGAKIELDASAASYDGDVTVKKVTE